MVNKIANNDVLSIVVVANILIAFPLGLLAFLCQSQESCLLRQGLIGDVHDRRLGGMWQSKLPTKLDWIV